MLQKWAHLVARRAWLVFIVCIVAVGLVGAYGSQVFNYLVSSGFQDKNAESTLESNQQATDFPTNSADIVVLFTSPTLKVTDPAYAVEISGYTQQYLQSSEVSSLQDYFTTGSTKFISKDQHQTFILLGLKGSDGDKNAFYNSIAGVTKEGPLTVQLGGTVAGNVQSNTQIKSDLSKAEVLSFITLAVLLIFIFASVTSAMVPLVLGGTSIIVALGITRAITHFAPMSVYAVNVITLLGLGLAIDYSLLLVGRFREELAARNNVEAALVATVSSAGRTILFSGLTVILSLLGLLVFPIDFLKSMGMGGAAAVVAAVILALTVLPALLGILGKHIDFLSLPYHRPSKKEVQHGFWYKFSQGITRRPYLVFVVALAVLLFLGSPFLKAQFTNTDATSIPTSLPVRQVYDALNDNFVGGSSEPIEILLSFNGNPESSLNLANLASYTKTIENFQGVTEVDSVLNIEAAAKEGAITPAAAVAAKAAYIKGDDTLVTVYQSFDPQSGDARTLVQNIRNLTPPVGATVEVGGSSAQLVDTLHSLVTHLGYAVLVIFAASFIFMFLLIGSIVIPVKAIVLNILSLSATYGILTWIFQEHHLASTFHLAALGSLDSTAPVLVFAIAFGLAMDYEFFLLSRIKEEHDKTGETAHAVAYGVQKTAAIITSAALLLVSVTTYFALSKFSLLQQIGLGLSLAVLVDATIVRLLLVPVTMELLGSANWWLPKPLQKLYARIGLKD